jgi:hypothetical protein
MNWMIMSFLEQQDFFRKDMASGLEGFTMSALLLFGKPEAIASAIPHYKIDALVRIKILRDMTIESIFAQTW